MHSNLFVVVALLLMAATAFGGKPTAGEIRRAHKWAVERFGDGTRPPAASAPFSFAYGGRPTSELLGTWHRSQSSRRLDRNRTERSVFFTDPNTRLIVTCTAVEYRDFPTVEWFLTLKNGGDIDGRPGCSRCAGDYAGRGAEGQSCRQ